MKFKLFLENELNSGNDGEFSKFKEWEAVKEKAKFVSVIVPIGYNIYEYKGIYYLLHDDKYVAYVQDYNEKLKNKTINIVSANSEERGAYKLLLVALLQKVKYIISDSILSVSATKFWDKVIHDSALTKVIIAVDDTVEYKGKEISVLTKYFNNPDFRIGLVSK